MVQIKISYLDNGIYLIDSREGKDRRREKFNGDRTVKELFDHLKSNLKE